MTNARMPWLTLTVTAVTGAGYAWQVADPHVLTLLRRDPTGLHWSNGWRLASPLLIQSDGAAQAAFNLVTLLVFGALVERAWGRRAWVVAYLGAGLVGQLIGYAWNPPGGGNSVAVCGLVGLIAAALLVGRPMMPGPALILAPYYPAALLGLDVAGGTGQVVAVVATAVVVSAVVVLGRRSQSGGPDQRPGGDGQRPGGDGRPMVRRPFEVGLGALMVTEAVAMLGYRDHHGAALLTGVALGVSLLAAGFAPVRGTGRRPRQPATDLAR